MSQNPNSTHLQNGVSANISGELFASYLNPLAYVNAFLRDHLRMAKNPVHRLVLSR